MNAEPTVAARTASAEPGVVINVSADVGRAAAHSIQAREVLRHEQAMLRTAQGGDPAAALEQERRVELAYCDADAAAAFEDALADGRL